MFTNKRFNKGYLLALVVLLVLFWSPIVLWLAAGGTPPSGPEEGGQSIPVGGILYVAVSVPAFLQSLFALIYAPIGIVSNAGSRMLHLGQFLVALLLLAPLAVGVFFVAIFWGGGPG